MRKAKQRSWIVNSGTGSLDYQKTIFTGPGLLDFLMKMFRRSYIVKSGDYYSLFLSKTSILGDNN